MAMPVRAFWSYVGNVERVRAEESRHMLNLLVSYQSEEGATNMFRVLDETIGEIVTYDGDNSPYMMTPEQQKAAWEKLRMKLEGMSG